MAESHLLSGLIKLRDEILGNIIYHQKEIKSLSENLTHIDKTIKVIDPEISLSRNGKGIQNKHFKNGQLTRLLIEILKENVDPMTTLEIAEKVKEKTGIKNISKMSVRSVLNAYAKKNVFVNLGRQGFNNEKSWVINDS
ncbi:MAG: hypothetical protein OEV44_15270 [Spirochaetota bacterium]|nr:hypothetical protein [Spirochaetota bacterium]